jgi:hypothetical protein
MKNVNWALKKLYDQKVSNMTNRTWVVKILILIEFFTLLVFVDEQLFKSQDSNYIMKYMYYLNIHVILRVIFINKNHNIDDISGECSSYLTESTTTNFMIGFVVFLGLSFLFLILTDKRRNLLYMIIVNLNNFLLRHIPHLTWFFINIQFVNPNNTSPGYVFFLFFLNMVLLSYSMFYVYYMWSEEIGFPYNYDNVKYEINAIFLKWLMSIIYVLDISAVCANKSNGNLVSFFKTMYIFLQFLNFTFFLYWRKEYYFSNTKINFFRMALQIFMCLHIIYEQIEEFFEIPSNIVDLIFFLIVFLLGIFSIRYLLIYLNNLSFQTNEDITCLFVFLSEKYIVFLNKNKKGSSKFFEKLYNTLFYHYLRSSCSNENSEIQDCIICSNQPQNFSVGNVETLLFNIFNDVARSDQFKKNNFYHHIIRIRSLFIISFKKGMDNMIFFEILKDMNKPQPSSTKIFFEYLYAKMIRSRDESSAYVASHMNFNKAVAYIDVCEEFNEICSEIKRTIELLKNRVRFEEIMKNARALNHLRKIVKRKVENLKEKDNLLLVNFYYNMMFNDTLKDTSALQKFYENINIIEENLFKLYLLLVEVDLKDKNLIMKNLTFDFLEKLKTKERNIKNDNLSKLFPPDLRNTQTRKIFSMLEDENRESFQLKFILQDDEKYIMYYQLFFKMIVSLNQKVHFMIQYKPMPSSDDTINNYMLISDEGTILGVSDQFRQNFYFPDNMEITKHNAFEFFKGPRIEFFDKLRSIDENVKDFEDSGRSTVRQLSFHMDELFKESFLERAANSHIYNPNSDEMINIICDENIFTETRSIFLLNFKKTKKQDYSRFEKTILYNEESNKEIDVLRPHNDIFSTIGAPSINYSVSSTKSQTYVRKENLAGVVASNDELFKKTVDKKSQENIQLFVYLLDLFIVIGSMCHLVWLYITLSHFQDTYNGLFYMRTLQAQFSLIALNSAKEIKMDGYQVIFESDSLLNDINTRSILNIYEYESIGHRLSDLKTFSNDNNMSTDITDLFNKQYINYVYASVLTGSLEVNSKTFIDLIDLLYIHMNKIKSVINIPISPRGLWLFEKQNDDIESLAFAYQNFYPVFEINFDKIVTLFVDSVTDSIDFLHLISYIYSLFYLAMHFIIYSFFLFYIYQYYKRHTTILNFISNLDDQHLNYLTFKVANLKKAIDFVITPQHLLGKLQVYNLKNKEKNTKQIKDKENNIHNPWANLIEKKVYLIPLEKFQVDHIKVHFLAKYVKTITYFLFVFIIFLTIMFMLFNYLIDDMMTMTKYTSNVVSIQINLYSSFLLFQLSLISNMNLTNQLDTPNSFKTRNEYFGYFQNKSMTILDSINELMNIEKNIQNKLDYKISEMGGLSLCDFAYDPTDPIFTKFSDSQGTYQNFFSHCQDDVKNEGLIIYQMIPYMMEYMRNSMNSLRMDENSRSSIFSTNLYHHITELLLIHVSRYFSRFREKIIEPLVFDGFTNFFHNLIYILASSLVIDILCFLLIKFFIINRIRKSSKIFSKLLNILKN